MITQTTANVQNGGECRAAGVRTPFALAYLLVADFHRPMLQERAKELGPIVKGNVDLDTWNF